MNKKIQATFIISSLLILSSVFIFSKTFANTSINTPVHGIKSTKVCAKEYERTSGTVSPDYQYGCCNGLTTFLTDEKDSGSMRIGGGLICAKKGFERIPNVKSIKYYKNIVKIGVGLYGYKK